jgi:hypothetical protein
MLKPGMTAFTEAVTRPGGPFAKSSGGEPPMTRQQQRYITRATLVLAALALAVVGFLSGALVQKYFGASRSNSSTTVAGGSTTNVVPAARVTNGTVKFVDGNTVYLQTGDGKIVTIKTSGSTAVQLTAHGALTDLSPGAQVSVEGSAAGDGVVNATKVTKGK